MSAATYKFETMSTATQKMTADQHTAHALRCMRKLIKPILRCLKKRQMVRKALAEVQQNAYNASLEDMRKDTANDDNLANEKLEQCIYQDAKSACTCPAEQQSNQFIPVHFVRTETGTYFWTSADLSREQELLLRSRFDRWGQA